MLTEDSGIRVGFSHLLTLLLASAWGTPYALVAQSIGPFRRLRALARALINGAVLVTVREDETLKHLAEIGCQKVDVTADLAFILAPSKIDQVAGFIPEEKFIGVSISQMAADRHRGFQRRPARGPPRHRRAVRTPSLECIFMRHRADHAVPRQTLKRRIRLIWLLPTRRTFEISLVARHKA